ncbi:hypothetical protein LTR99_010318 [Exophiala xenobiotica]|nr:hypothetical protein LTR72_007834 [Exophiala xenobiotica]KAK5538078.1 hypothetical protein LTR23_007215 [Chaetothyriales sp. CCFEE 6169]KAK5226568.1 hypothetical protein LTR47_009025 [Exophiala xenobiotica]KAK5251515.1 hypothetical protein LTS06_003872 [Exophiala xenobiotica]KAK5264028.1 hypothetical protein LTR96_010536 [Exophiala xenobiotica]
MTTESNKSWPREGYRPEWLALEDASGGRYAMTGDFAVDVPTYDAVFAAFSKQWPELPEELKVWDEKTDSQHGELDVRIYKPASDKPLPLMIYYPGGGYIAGNLDTEDAHCRIFAAKTPCLVISVNYPKVPAVKLDDIINLGALAIPWCREKAQQLGDNPSKTILCGGSAGAFLSAQVAYQLMSEGDHTTITGCVLLFAVALHWDYNGKYKHMYTAWDENGNAGTPVFGLELAKFIWSHYDVDFSSPRHFPLLADDLSKFPPCYIVTAEKDCFRDDGKLLDYRLRESGVRNKLDHYEGLPHYFHVFPQLAVAHEAMAKAVEGARFVLE